jgi:hypothetical protein
LLSDDFDDLAGNADALLGVAEGASLAAVLRVPEGLPADRQR